MLPFSILRFASLRLHFATGIPIYIISQQFRFYVWIWICRLAGGTLRRICWATNEFIAICNSVLLHFSFLVWLHILLLALNRFACIVPLVIAAVVKGLYLLLQTCFHSHSQHLLWQFAAGPSLLQSDTPGSFCSYQQYIVVETMVQSVHQHAAFSHDRYL